MSQISLDFAKAGIPTLWGSFEVKNTRLLSKMLHQYHKGGDLTQLDSEKLNQLANDFEQLPLYFLNFHGGTDLAEVMEALDVAVRTIIANKYN